MKILILGNGQLGNYYKNYLSFVSHEVQLAAKVDITNINSIRSYVAGFNPEVVINTAAKTNLEWCEENMKEAYKVNVDGAKNVADVCEDLGIYLVHLSSACIFESKDAKDVKTEESEPYPAAYYGWTKVWAERLVMRGRSENFSALILRPRQPVSPMVDYKNMLIKFLTFTQFVDTPNTGTVIDDLMKWTVELIEKRYHGVVNAANVGWTTPYQIAQVLRSYVLPSLPIEKITKEELDEKTPTKRVDTVLDVSLLKSLVKEVRLYPEAIVETIQNLALNFKYSDKKDIKRELSKAAKFTAQRATPNEEWKDLL